jgi:hypothetical protein
MFSRLSEYRMFKKGLYNCIPNAAVFGSVTRTSTPKGVQTIHRSSCSFLNTLHYQWRSHSTVAITGNVGVFCYIMTVQNIVHVLWTNSYKLSTFYSSFWNTLYYQWTSHWTVAIPVKTRCVLLHHDSPKLCTRPLNKFIQAFNVVQLFLKHPALPVDVTLNRSYHR